MEAIKWGKQSYKFNGTEQKHEISKLNIFIIDPKQQIQGVIIPETYAPKGRSRPRVRDPIYVPPKQEKAKWSLPISLFKDYQKDTEELLDKCFDFDWKCARISTFVDSSEEEKVKKTLRYYYGGMKNLYKYYSGVSATEVWCIGKNLFTDLVSNQMDLFDQRLNLAAAYIEWEVIRFPLEFQVFHNPRMTLSLNLSRRPTSLRSSTRTIQKET